MIENCPCKGCKDRTADPNCHELCERYKAFTARVAEENRNARREHERYVNSIPLFIKPGKKMKRKK